MSSTRRAILFVLSFAVLGLAVSSADARDVRVRVGARTSSAVPVVIVRGHLMLPLAALENLGLPVRSDDVHNVLDVGCLRVRTGSVRVSFMPAATDANRMRRAPDLPLAVDRNGAGPRVPIRALLAPFGFRMTLNSDVLTLLPPDAVTLEPERATCALALAAWLTGER